MTLKPGVDVDAQMEPSPMWQPVDVRPAGPQDWADKRTVRLAALQDAPYAFCSTYEQAARRTEEEWRAWPAPPSAVLLAWHGAEPVGIVGIGPRSDRPDTAELFAMWVAPSARGSGAADRLIEAAVALARDQGCGAVELEVTAGNERATRTYRRHGFDEFDTSTSMPGGAAMRLTFG